MRREGFLSTTVSLPIFAVKGVRVIKLGRIVHHSVHHGQKPGNLVKAVEGAPESIGRELPTTHRVVIYAMVITCSSVTAAVAAAANPLRLPWHSSCLSALSFSLASSSLSLSPSPLRLPTHPSVSR